MMNISTTNLCLAGDAAVDLHLHTKYSDGHWTAERLIDHLIGEGFALAAITDHDRVDTAAAIQELALEKRLPVLVGAEISATWRGEMVDMLCYGFDPQQYALIELAQDLMRRQQENTRAVFETLQREGYGLPPDALPTLLETPNVQQPHALADVLREHGRGGELRNTKVGKILLDAGCAFALCEPAAVVEAAHRSGAVCLLAHPGRGEGFVDFDVPLLDLFRQEAAVDGLEVYHPSHTPEKSAAYLEYARGNDLLVSAGSDSHKPEKPPIQYRADVCRALLERVGIEVFG